MSVRIAEAAVLGPAVALGSQGLDERDEIGGMRGGILTAAARWSRQYVLRVPDGQSPKTSRTRAFCARESIAASSMAGTGCQVTLHHVVRIPRAQWGATTAAP